MKRVATSFISLAMILFFASLAYPRINSNTEILPLPSPSFIRYAVTVNYTPVTPLCGHYLVLITDGKRHPVAPMQTFVPGVAVYTFYESTGRDITGVRTAWLVFAPPVDAACQKQLFTQPESIYELFRVGETYQFTLNPSNQRPPHD